MEKAMGEADWRTVSKVCRDNLLSLLSGYVMRKFINEIRSKEASRLKKSLKRL